MSKPHEIFSTCCLHVAVAHLVTTTQYVMYFRFCERRHVTHVCP